MKNLPSKQQIINRYKGCVVGEAVGDALGRPAELLSPDEIRKKYGVLKEMFKGGIPPNRYKGQTTDDTDTTLCIIDSLIDNNRYVPKDIARRFLLWYKSNPPDIGGTTKLSLSRLARGESWQNSGRIAVSLGAKAGNGSLMRTAPVGLYFRGSAKDIDKAAAEISAITHANPDCITACQIASQLIALLATGYSKEDSIELVKEMYPAASEAGVKLRKALDGVYNDDGFGYVLNTLGIALTSFIEARNFEEAVIKAIHFGWDTDTQACVTGAFAGSLWGVQQIPSRWAEKLNPTSHTQLQEKAEKLYILNKKIARTCGSRN